MSGVAISKYYGVYQGLPAAGGSLYTYQTGTTTQQTTYSDAALMTPLANPIILDANGCAAFYYSGSVNLKLVAYTASGTLIETLDPVYPTGGTAIGTTVKVSSNTTLTATNAGQNLVSTTAVNLTLPLSTTQAASFNFNVNSQGGAVTLVPQSSDAIQSGAAGSSYVIAVSSSADVWTDANGNYGLNFYQAPVKSAPALLLTLSPSASANISINSTYLTSSYANYELKYNNAFITVSACTLLMQVSTNNGSSLISSGYGYSGITQAYTSALTNTGTSSTTSFDFNIGAGNFGGTLAGSDQGSLRFNNTLIGVSSGLWITGEGYSNGAFIVRKNMYLAATATGINYLKIYPSASSGLLTGTFELWGIP